jgi:SAM-dependent methyltransferase
MAVVPRQHWEQVYEQRQPDEVSWYEPLPQRSLALIGSAQLDKDAAIIDVGGGTSSLAVELVSAGYKDVTVADISARAIEQAREEAGEVGERINWVPADVRRHDFGRPFDLWHDRVLFHFMVDEDDQDAYLATLRASLSPGGGLVIATFGPDGPERCSGLPVRRYGRDELADRLGPEFAEIHSELAIHRTPSGKDQQFLWGHFHRLTSSFRP